MKIVFDKEVILELLINRSSFASDAKKTFSIFVQNGIEAAVTATSKSPIAYRLRKHMRKDHLKTVILGMMELFHVIEVNGNNCKEAFSLPMPDYEDALLAHCAKCWNADYIITQHIKGFEGSPVPAMLPQDLILQFNRD